MGFIVYLFYILDMDCLGVIWLYFCFLKNYIWALEVAGIML